MAPGASLLTDCSVESGEIFRNGAEVCAADLKAMSLCVG
jgi:hypothetical protein